MMLVRRPNEICVGQIQRVFEAVESGGVAIAVGFWVEADGFGVFPDL